MLVLTNDDGYDAPGLAALRAAAEGLGTPRVVAPLAAESGCGHRVTTHEPLHATAHAGEVVAVSGTPADCVRLALHHLAADAAWVLAGINAGGNLGVDVFHSGTVAAVREAVIHGVPGIALSHYIARGRAIDWDRAARWARPVLIDLLGRPWTPGTFWNVNLPHPAPDAPDPEVVFCPLDPSPLPLRFEVEGGRSLYRGDYQQRPRREGGDVAVCFGGRITVSLVRLFDAGPPEGGSGPEPVAGGG
ncbi:5'/3'-nucleotidase SurE [Paludisphaera mucosa]|uniref:5'-nucleotidase n=1 Tax=Paludisphaera mucosa TaxID=3030827 RepID=A0ABT6FCM5_9BACT|nr:5'/3'-nucleotidase SurE [Paludisphaera mucosa]MDG3005194.1 5'/3'-nucleotidase SurE [Paludisphaera mucosa]